MNRRTRLATLVVAGVVAGGGVALGGALLGGGFLDSGGAYHGCVNATNGALRVVQPGETCREHETAIDWSRGGGSGAASFQALDGTPCTLGGKTGATALSQGDGSGTFYMNAVCLVPDRFEPNDTEASAANLIAGAAYASFATLTADSHDDWYSLPATSLYWVTVQIDAGLPLARSGVIELYEDGTLVATGPSSGSVGLSFYPGGGAPHDWLLHVASPDVGVYNFSFGY